MFNVRSFLPHLGRNLEMGSQKVPIELENDVTLMRLVCSLASAKQAFQIRTKDLT
jgi:hypothetical protein